MAVVLDGLGLILFMTIVLDGLPIFWPKFCKLMLHSVNSYFSKCFRLILRLMHYISLRVFLKTCIVLNSCPVIFVFYMHEQKLDQFWGR